MFPSPIMFSRSVDVIVYVPPSQPQGHAFEQFNLIVVVSQVQSKPDSGLEGSKHLKFTVHVDSDRVHLLRSNSV